MSSNGSANVSNGTSKYNDEFGVYVTFFDTERDKTAVKGGDKEEAFTIVYEGDNIKGYNKNEIRQDCVAISRVQGEAVKDKDKEDRNKDESESLKDNDNPNKGREDK